MRLAYVHMRTSRCCPFYHPARWHSSGPHFNRSLEWLLFTALEIDADTRPHGTTAGAAGAAAQQDAPILGSPIGAGPTARQARFNSSYSVTVGGAAAPASKRASEQRQAGPLLLAAARLISQFPQVCAGRSEVHVFCGQGIAAAAPTVLSTCQGTAGPACPLTTTLLPLMLPPLMLPPIQPHACPSCSPP